MKTLCLIRHAKTSWMQPNAPDRCRPLDERGIEDASILSQYLIQKNLKPELILSSPSERTHHTAKILAQALSCKEELISIQEKIYEAGVEDLLCVLQNIPNNLNVIFLVGHNPSITMLANYLSDKHIASIQTAGAFCLELDIDDWQQITLAEVKNFFEYHPPHHLV